LKEELREAQQESFQPPSSVKIGGVQGMPGSRFLSEGVYAAGEDKDKVYLFLSFSISFSFFFLSFFLSLSVCFFSSSQSYCILFNFVPFRI